MRIRKGALPTQQPFYMRSDKVKDRPSGDRLRFFIRLGRIPLLQPIAHSAPVNSVYPEQCLGVGSSCASTFFLTEEVGILRIFNTCKNRAWWLN